MAMARTAAFEAWARKEAGRVTGVAAEIETAVERSMARENIKVEIKNEKGLWVETDFDLPADLGL